MSLLRSLCRPASLTRALSTASPSATLSGSMFSTQVSRPFSTQVLTSGTTGDWVPSKGGRIQDTSLPYRASEEKEIARFDPGDPSKRAFTYFMLGGAKAGYASLARLMVIKFVSTMSATADVLAAAVVEVDLSKIPEGTSATIKWQGKPVFIKHRTDKDIEEANQVDVSALRDPESDSDRVINPKWLVLVGICTHLGCVPIADAGDYNGYFCPCHGSHYDGSGRIRKGPAPLNLEVPFYEFMDENTISIGKV
eukprot:Rmarinus@m.19467